MTFKTENGMRIFITSLLMLVALHSFSQSDVDTVKYKIEYRDSNDTYLKVYFIDKTLSEPISDDIDISIEVDDSTSTKVNYKLILDKRKDPIPFLLKPLNYTFTSSITGVIHLQLQEKKINTLYIYAKWGELQFRYSKARNTPVNYEAKVYKRKSEKPPTIQKCTDKIAYQPGEYYVEINTIPIYKSAISLAYENLYEIQIQKPGTLLVNSSNETSDIRIYYYVMNDCFEITNVDFNDSNIFPIKLLSYKYKITWKLKGKKQETIFAIKPDETIKIDCF